MSDLNDDIKAGLKVTWVGLAANFVLVILKLGVGYSARSQALIADGVHSISDLFSDLVVMLGFRWGRKAEDEDHPYGHARIETIASMIVGFLLLLVAVGIAYDAIGSITDPNTEIPGFTALWVAAFSIILKEVLFWYTRAVGKRLRSPALMANAWHHRSDALSSVAVLIGLGITLFNPAWSIADSIAALVVTAFVGRVGIDFVLAAFRELSDTAPDREVIDQMIEIASKVDGVRQVHDMRSRRSGSYIFAELDIVVDPELTVREGHAIADTVKATLLDGIEDLSRVIVHVDPEKRA